MLCDETLDLEEEGRLVVEDTPIAMESCVTLNGIDRAVFPRLPACIRAGKVTIGDGGLDLPASLQACRDAFDDAALLPIHAAMGSICLSLWWALGEAGYTLYPPNRTVTRETWAISCADMGGPTHTEFLSAVDGAMGSDAPWSFRMAYEDGPAEGDFRCVAMGGAEVDLVLTRHGDPVPAADAHTKWVPVPTVGDVLAPATSRQRVKDLVDSITCSSAPSSSRWVSRDAAAHIVTPKGLDAVAAVYAAVDVETDSLRVHSAPDLATWHYWGDDAVPSTAPHTRLRSTYPWIDAFITAAESYIDACGLGDWVRVVGTPKGAAIDVRALPAGTARGPGGLRPAGPGIDNPLVVPATDLAELGVSLWKDKVPDVVLGSEPPAISVDSLLFKPEHAIAWSILTRGPTLRSSRGALARMGWRVPQVPGEWDAAQHARWFPRLVGKDACVPQPRTSAMPDVELWSNAAPICLERVVQALVSMYPKKVGKLVETLRRQAWEQDGPSASLTAKDVLGHINATQRRKGRPELTSEQGNDVAMYVFGLSTKIATCDCDQGASSDACPVFVLAKPPTPATLLAHRRGEQQEQEQAIDTPSWLDAFIPSSSSDDSDGSDDDDFLDKLEQDAKTSHKIHEFFPAARRVSGVDTKKKRHPVTDDDQTLAHVVISTVTAAITVEQEAATRSSKRVRVGVCV